MKLFSAKKLFKSNKTTDMKHKSVLREMPNTAENTIFFMQLDGQNRELLKLCQNGDIFVKGRLAENDKEVVDALKQFLISQGLIK